MNTFLTFKLSRKQNIDVKMLWENLYLVKLTKSISLENNTKIGDNYRKTAHGIMSLLRLFSESKSTETTVLFTFDAKCVRKSVWLRKSLSNNNTFVSQLWVKSKLKSSRSNWPAFVDCCCWNSRHYRTTLHDGTDYTHIWDSIFHCAIPGIPDLSSSRYQTWIFIHFVQVSK